MHGSASSPGVKERSGNRRDKTSVNGERLLGGGFQTILIPFLMAFCLAFYQFSSVKVYPFSNQTQNVFYFKGEKELKTELTRPWKLAGGRGWRRRSSGEPQGCSSGEPQGCCALCPLESQSMALQTAVLMAFPW